MEVIRVRSEHEGGQKAFALVAHALANGARVLGLATGSSPVALYKEMVQSDLDFSEVETINLDEYVGIDAKNHQSYHYFMEEQLFAHKSFKAHYLPDGQSQDLKKSAKDYDKIVSQHPIDVQILGIGRNGHIGFNEPGTSFESKTHVVNLKPSTIEANARFFDAINDVPTQAISMGITSILSAKHIILLAYGVEKAEAVLGMVKGAVTEDLPASILQRHPKVTVIVDEAAGSLL